MDTLTVLVEIALDDDDTDGKIARKLISDISDRNNVSLFIDDHEFLVVSARVES